MNMGKVRNKDRSHNWQLCGVWNSSFVTT